MRDNVTIKEVAKAANVSVGTASMSLNEKKGVSVETRKKVKRIARKMGYLPNQAAKSLVTTKSDCIGLIVPEVINPFYSAIVDIMSKLAQQRGYTLLLGISNNDSRQEEKYIEMFLLRRVFGVVIVPTLFEYPDIGYLELLRKADVPFVFCTERYMNADEPGAMCDFEQGEYELICYLLERGIRDICFLTVDTSFSYAVLRMKGLQRAFAENGLNIAKKNIIFLESPNFECAYEATDAILQNKPEAIVTINDIMAIGVMKRLFELGIQIPKDIWVAGFDDMMFAKLAQTPITTVKQPIWEICCKCMEILDHKIENTAFLNGSDDKMHHIKAELIVRDTTG